MNSFNNSELDKHTGLLDNPFNRSHMVAANPSISISENEVGFLQQNISLLCKKSHRLNNERDMTPRTMADMPIEYKIQQLQKKLNTLGVSLPESESGKILKHKIKKMNDSVIQDVS